MQDFPLALLQSLNKLEILNISSSYVDIHLQREFFAGLNTLRELSVSGSGINSDLLKPLLNLESLVLFAMPGAYAFEMPILPKLKSLSMRDYNFDKVTATEFSKSNSIESLHLQGTFTKINSAFLSSLKKLTLLKIENWNHKDMHQYPTVKHFPVQMFEGLPLLCKVDLHALLDSKIINSVTNELKTRYKSIEFNITY